MATPIISTLRRNQGYVLAIMGVVLIFTWVIGQPAIDFLSGGNGRGDAGRGSRERPVVVQWTKGSTTRTLTEADIQQLRQEHRAVLEFVNSVVTTAVDKDVTPQAPGLRLPNQQTGGQIQLGLPMDTSEATVVNILLFYERGRELGVRVDKAAMVHYLKNLSGFSLDEGNFVELAQKTVSEATKSNQLLSVDSLFAALRKELVSQQARYMLASSTSNVSTGELWDYHKQLNLRYKIEAYPVDVEKMKASFKASDAKQEELLALFEKGKNNVPDPNRPEPGFRIPHRIAFGYCTVDFDPFLQQAKKNVPEAKAIETYKTGVNQGRFRKVTLPGLPGATKPGETKPGETKPGETKPGETKPGETKPGEEKTPPAKTEGDAPAEPEKKEPEKKEPPKVDETKPAEEKTEEKAKEEPAKPAEEKPAEEKPEQVAVICEEESAKAAEPAEAKPAEEKADEKPAEEAPAKEESKAEPAKPATTAPATETSAGEKTEDPAKTEPKTEEVKHKTYEEARDEILTELAQPEAVLLRDEAVRSAMDDLRIYSTKLARFEESKKQAADTDTQVDVENPGDFRPAGFAAKYKFRYGKTSSMDQYEVQETELGRAAVLRGQRGSLSFSQFAYFERANLYDPRDVDSLLGDTRFIYWRIADQPEQDVALERDGSFPPGVKEKVEEAWLTEKAYEAARKRAEELAAKAKGTSLKDLVGKTEAIKVVEPFPFSMYTTDGVSLMFSGQPNFSRPHGVPLAGQEFMDAVFSLKPGEAGIAPDQPHKVVYVVRVLGDEPSLEIRREMFLTALQRGRMSDLMIFADMQLGHEGQGLFVDLEKHYSVQWMRAINAGDGGE